MSNTNRRARTARSNGARVNAQRRTTTADTNQKDAATASPQATEPQVLVDAPVHTTARFSVIERSAPRDLKPDCPFAVVETETDQVPENWFGQSQRGYHRTRESAEAEADELNELAERFIPAAGPGTIAVLLLTPLPVDSTGLDPSAESGNGDEAASMLADTFTSGVLGAPPSGPIDAPGPMLGESRTAWEQELLTSTNELPAITDDTAPAAMPTPTDTDEAAGTAPDDKVKDDDASAADNQPADALTVAEAAGNDDASTVQLPRIIDALRAEATPTRRPVGRHAQDSRRRVGDPSPIKPKAPQQINPGQQVLCSDGSWHTVANAGIHDGTAVLLIEDGTEHAYTGSVQFWVRNIPSWRAPVSPVRPPCPNNCTATNDRLHLCRCSWGCGCAPHPAGPMHRSSVRNPRRPATASAGA